jgi:hypothetical protein
MGRIALVAAVAPALIGLIFVLATAPVVEGQSGTTIQISPPNFELEADAGQVLAQEIMVSNRGDGPLPITMQVSGFVPVGQQGGVGLTEAEQAEFGIVSWTTVTPGEFLLQPKEDKVITFLIDVPADAPPGGHYVSILASIGSSGSGGLAVGQRIGALVLLRVAGDIVEQAELASFSGPTLAAKGPVTFDLLVSNSGNVHVRPAAALTVKGTFGGEITKLTLEPQNVLPESERAFSAEWDTGWRIGRYTVEYEGVYGSQNTPLTGSITVIIFPWPIAAPVLAVLLVLAFLVIRGRQRLARTLRVLTGQE